MPAHILSNPPLSGSIPERQYDAIGACTWVEFTPEDDLPWAGVFGHHGVAAHSGVFEFATDPIAFVIAHGVGWVVNVDTGVLAYKTSQDCLVTAAPFPDQPFVVAADWTNVYAYGVDHHIWSSERIARDGIRFDDHLQGGAVTGQCWQTDDWVKFQVHNNPWRTIWPDRTSFPIP